MSRHRSPLQQRCATFFGRPRIILASLFLLTAVAACKDDGIIGIATAENTADTVTVYALSGSPTQLPAAYNFVSQSLVRPQLTSSGRPNFELAFDIDAQGRVVLMPARAVVPDAPQAASSVGILKMTTSYESIVRAPDKGYAINELAYGQVGDTFVLQLISSGCTYGEPIYAKVGIDSVFASERRIVFSTVINRNCGFRALTTGLPKN